MVQECDACYEGRMVQECDACYVWFRSVMHVMRGGDQVVQVEMEGNPNPNLNRGGGQVVQVEMEGGRDLKRAKRPGPYAP